jgi:hypothetical protein
VVIRLHTDPENRGTGAYQLLTPYTHGVPHVDCEGPSAVTRTNLLLPPGRKVMVLVLAVTEFNSHIWPLCGCAHEGLPAAHRTSHGLMCDGRTMLGRRPATPRRFHATKSPFSQFQAICYCESMHTVA